MRLALAARTADVDGLLSSISSRQLTEWMALEMVEPWGEWRMDWRLAQLMAMIANLFARREGDRPWEPVDFMPRQPGEEPTSSSSVAVAGDVMDELWLAYQRAQSGQPATAEPGRV